MTRACANNALYPSLKLVEIHRAEAFESEFREINDKYETSDTTESCCLRNVAMAFKKNNYDLQGILFLMFLTIPAITTTNIDCNGKAFHCLNSTHFMICVDLGGGVSRTIDSFVIPCPATTFCKSSNRFECEFEIVNTEAPTTMDVTTLQSVTEDPTTPQEIMSTIPFEEYYNTLSLTTSESEYIQSSTIKAESTAPDLLENLNYSTYQSHANLETAITGNFDNPTTEIASDPTQNYKLETSLIPEIITVSSANNDLIDTETKTNTTNNSVYSVSVTPKTIEETTPPTNNQNVSNAEPLQKYTTITTYTNYIITTDTTVNSNTQSNILTTLKTKLEPKSATVKPDYNIETSTDNLTAIFKNITESITTQTENVPSTTVEIQTTPYYETTTHNTLISSSSTIKQDENNNSKTFDTDLMDIANKESVVNSTLPNTEISANDYTTKYTNEVTTKGLKESSLLMNSSTIVPTSENIVTELSTDKNNINNEIFDPSESYSTVITTKITSTNTVTPINENLAISTTNNNFVTNQTENVSSTTVEIQTTPYYETTSNNTLISSSSTIKQDENINSITFATDFIDIANKQIVVNSTLPNTEISANDFTNKYTNKVMTEGLKESSLLTNNTTTENIVTELSTDKNNINNEIFNPNVSHFTVVTTTIPSTNTVSSISENLAISTTNSNFVTENYDVSTNAGQNIMIQNNLDSVTSQHLTTNIDKVTVDITDDVTTVLSELAYVTDNADATEQNIVMKKSQEHHTERPFSDVFSTEKYIDQIVSTTEVDPMSNSIFVESTIVMGNSAFNTKLTTQNTNNFVPPSSQSTSSHQIVSETTAQDIMPNILLSDVTTIPSLITETAHRKTETVLESTEVPSTAFSPEISSFVNHIIVDITEPILIEIKNYTPATLNNTQSHNFTVLLSDKNDNSTSNVNERTTKTTILQTEDSTTKNTLLQTEDSSVTTLKEQSNTKLPLTTNTDSETVEIISKHAITTVSSVISDNLKESTVNNKIFLNEEKDLIMTTTSNNQMDLTITNTPKQIMKDIYKYIDTPSTEKTIENNKLYITTVDIGSYKQPTTVNNEITQNVITKPDDTSTDTRLETKLPDNDFSDTINVDVSTKQQEITTENTIKTKTQTNVNPVNDQVVQKTIHGEIWSTEQQATTTDKPIKRAVQPNSTDIPLPKNPLVHSFDNNELPTTVIDQYIEVKQGSPDTDDRNVVQSKTITPLSLLTEPLYTDQLHVPTVLNAFGNNKQQTSNIDKTTQEILHSDKKTEAPLQTYSKVNKLDIDQFTVTPADDRSSKKQIKMYTEKSTTEDGKTQISLQSHPSKDETYITSTVKAEESTSPIELHNTQTGEHYSNTLISESGNVKKSPTSNTHVLDLNMQIAPTITELNAIMSSEMPIELNINQETAGEWKKSKPKEPYYNTFVTENGIINEETKTLPGDLNTVQKLYTTTTANVIMPTETPIVTNINKETTEEWSKTKPVEQYYYTQFVTENGVINVDSATEVHPANLNTDQTANTTHIPNTIQSTVKEEVFINQEANTKNNMNNIPGKQYYNSLVTESGMTKEEISGQKLPDFNVVNKTHTTPTVNVKVITAEPIELYMNQETAGEWSRNKLKEQNYKSFTTESGNIEQKTSKQIRNDFNIETNIHTTPALNTVLSSVGPTEINIIQEAVNDLKKNIKDGVTKEEYVGGKQPANKNVLEKVTNYDNIQTSNDVLFVDTTPVAKNPNDIKQIIKPTVQMGDTKIDENVGISATKPYTRTAEVIPSLIDTTQIHGIKDSLPIKEEIFNSTESIKPVTNSIKRLLFLNSRTDLPNSANSNNISTKFMVGAVAEMVKIPVKNNDTSSLLNYHNDKKDMGLTIEKLREEENLTTLGLSDQVVQSSSNAGDVIKLKLNSNVTKAAKNSASYFNKENILPVKLNGQVPTSDTPTNIAYIETTESILEINNEVTGSAYLPQPLSITIEKPQIITEKPDIKVSPKFIYNINQGTTMHLTELLRISKNVNPDDNKNENKSVKEISKSQDTIMPSTELSEVSENLNSGNSGNNNKSGKESGNTQGTNELPEIGENSSSHVIKNNNKSEKESDQSKGAKMPLTELPELPEISENVNPGDNNNNNEIRNETSGQRTLQSQLNCTGPTHESVVANDGKNTKHSVVTKTSDFQSSTVRYLSPTKSTSADNQNKPLPTSVTDKSKFVCRYNYRGRFADKDDCRKFYICIGRLYPLEGICPVNTVFSEIRKQCTKNLSHCVRNNQFQCTSEGRFSDFLNDNLYYICIKNKLNLFVRFKLQCQNGYHLNKTSVKCVMNTKSSLSISSDNSKNSDQSISQVKIKDNKSNDNVFECENEGKFVDPDNCRIYYICKKNKSEYRRKRKKCESDEVFHSEKKKCVDADSYECN